MSQSERSNSPRWWQGINRKIGSLAPVSWVAARSMHHIDGLFFNVSNGRHTAVSLLLGLPIVTLTSVGAKSGLPRSVPLIGIPDGDRVVLIASNWGQARHPSWYHNLTANPRVRLAFDQTESEYIAHEAKGEEYNKLWAKAASIYGGYEAYRKRTGRRRIPIVVLTPVGDDT